MSKKTFISNQELELTQKIQLQFPRDLIPSEVLTYWGNCPSDVLQTVLMDAFYFLENPKDTRIKVRRPIPLKLPHNENLSGHFYFESNTDLSERGCIFDIKDIKIIEIKDTFKDLSPSEKILFFIEKEGIIEKQLDIFQLWAIYLRGYDFFLQNFHGIIYALRSTFYIKGEFYFPYVSINSSKEKTLQIGWSSSWNNFTKDDLLLQF